MWGGLDQNDLTYQRAQASGFWDGGREGFFAFATVCLLAIALFNSFDVSWLSRFSKICLTFAVGAGAAFVVGRWVGSARCRKRAVMAQQYREDQARITERKISEMNARTQQSKEASK